METKSRIVRHLKELRLPTIRACFEAEADLARRNGLSFEQYLLEVFEREMEARRQSRIERFLHESGLPLEKTLASLDRSRLPQKVDSHINLLVEGAFVDRAENVLAFGNPGSGKTHLLCAIANELIHRGRRILFTSCGVLVEGLLAAKRDLKLTAALKRLGRYDAVLIDDIGYVQQGREEMEVLFSFMANRYEQASIMVTSNLPFSKWEQIFKDPMTTAAAIDRVVHHSIILELNIPSYRLEHSRKQAPRSES
jgi:DNA replication protein DnaC